MKSIMHGSTLGFRARLEAELQRRAGAGELSKAQLATINGLSRSVALARRALAKLEAGGLGALPGETAAAFGTRRQSALAVERGRLKDLDEQRLQWLLENL